MRILLFSSLFPNKANPSLGVFVENRLRHLLADTDIEAKVIAPVPYFPFKAAIFGGYSRYAQAPVADTRNGVDILYPRYLHLPKIGGRLQARFMARAGLKAAKKLMAEGFDFDVIDAHYLYPDGVAASMVATALGKPFTMTARGSDVTEIFQSAPYDTWIRQAAEKAGQMMTVSESLRRDLIAGGVDALKIATLRNGVDTSIFYPDDYDTARQRLIKACNIDGAIAADGKLLLSVGWLIPRKGNHWMIDAIAQRPKDHFILIGEGPERQRLQQMAEDKGIKNRVHFLGAIEHHALRLYMSGADILTLLSDREGWPNVLLEAMACGTPVAATNVGGVGEFVTVPEAGRVLEGTSAEVINAGLDNLLQNYPKRDDVVRYASKFSWTETSLHQKEIFERLSRTGYSAGSVVPNRKVGE